MLSRAMLGFMEYRVFALKDGKIAGASTVIDCESDDEAMAKVTAMLSDHALEVWQGARRVARLEPKNDEKK
jgi:predicted mannosyl-3-phosphoglycerate phosphatase (HAD superfamily)